MHAYRDFDMVKVADGAFDLIWVTIGLCYTLGIPIDEVWSEGARSNLAKIVDGKVIKNENGKVMKPEGWTPPDFKSIIECSRQMRTQNNATNVFNKSEY
jgi:predicted HAD superfamily Cof-like phosphohydrolase